MAVLNPEHLLDQALLLVNATPGRKPRQVNLRRAISTAYYAVFHQLLTAAADEVVNKGMRGDSRHSLVYRSIDHGAVKRICNEAAQPTPTPKYRNFVPLTGFEPTIRRFSIAFLQLQSRRHDADYDPSQMFTTVDALFAIDLAENALNDFASFSAEGRKLFLILMLFSPR